MAEKYIKLAEIMNQFKHASSIEQCSREVAQERIDIYFSSSSIKIHITGTH